MRRLFLGFVMLSVLPGLVRAQGSQFGIRGLGLPGRGASVRALGMGGAFTLFDAESSRNPAAVTSLRALATGFTVLQEWRSVTNPAGEASLRDSRFPLVRVAGPIKGIGVWLGGSVSLYTDQDFRIASVDTVMLRGVPVGVADTSTSLGGMSDLQLAGAIRLSDSWSVGVGFHVITGVSRLEARRTFADTSFASFTQRAEVSRTGFGFSAGIIGQVTPALVVALSARSDTKADTERDSTELGTVDLPHRVSAGIRWQARRTLALAGHVSFQTWSAANSDLLERGGLGAMNTWEVAVGGELVGDPERPYRRPLRFGFRYTQLPFPLTLGQQGRELGVSLGTGARFAALRAGVDFALERVWRREGTGFSETAWILTAGVSITP
jgi:hypothetical protein